MSVKEIEARTILQKRKKIDSWFLSCYSMNLYRGCMHNCIYCDGRADKYNVQGTFGKDVAVKVNAPDILKRELMPSKRRQPLKKSYFMIGGGVGDSYQPLEEKYLLTRQTLELMYEHALPVHILTKSALVKRDLDIIKKINQKTRAIVSFSFSGVDEKTSSLVEPQASSCEERLEALALFKEQGVSCGMFLLPVIPFLTDTPEMIEQAVHRAADIGIDFIIFGGMTLKAGKQKEYFLNACAVHFPQITPAYEQLYTADDPWGQARPDYYNSLHLIFNRIASRYAVPGRIPLPLFKDIVNEDDRVIVILEHIDYFLRIQGQKTPYGYAAYALSRLKQPLKDMRGKLRNIQGIGRVTESIVSEILDTGTSSYYEKLLRK